jgi:acylglycerol lipase
LERRQHTASHRAPIRAAAYGGRRVVFPIFIGRPCFDGPGDNMERMTPHAHVFKLENEDSSRDPAVVAMLNADPLIANESQPSETIAELVRGDQLLEKSLRQITLPVLILHGTADKVTSPNGSKEFYEKVGSSDKTLKLYEGHFHDLLADVGKQQVMSDIQAWIDAHLGMAIPSSRHELRT